MIMDSGRRRGRSVPVIRTERTCHDLPTTDFHTGKHFFLIRLSSRVEKEGKAYTEREIY